MSVWRLYYNSCERETESQHYHLTNLLSMYDMALFYHHCYEVNLKKSINNVLFFSSRVIQTLIMISRMM